MARPPTSPAERRAQRQRIYDAASQLHASGGRRAVTVRAVAERAEMSQGAIYAHFTSVSELLRALWAEPVAAAGEQLEVIAAATPDPVDRIRALLDGFTSFALEHPEVHRGAMLFVRPADQPTPSRVDPTVLAFFRLLVEALTDAAATGQITVDDPDRMARLIWAAMHGALALPVNADIYEIASQQELATDMTALIVDHLLTGDGTTGP